MKKILDLAHDILGRHGIGINIHIVIKYVLIFLSPAQSGGKNLLLGY